MECRESSPLATSLGFIARPASHFEPPVKGWQMTTTTARGVIRGATIVLNEPPTLADGAAVELQIRMVSPSPPAPGGTARGLSLGEVAELVQAHQAASPRPVARSRTEIDADLAALRDESEDGFVREKPARE